MAELSDIQLVVRRSSGILQDCGFRIGGWKNNVL
jgi:hypothetical protein